MQFDIQAYGFGEFFRILRNLGELYNRFWLYICFFFTLFDLGMNFNNFVYYWTRQYEILIIILTLIIFIVSSILFVIFLIRFLKFFEEAITIQGARNIMIQLLFSEAVFTGLLKLTLTLYLVFTDQHLLTKTQSLIHIASVCKCACVIAKAGDDFEQKINPLLVLFHALMISSRMSLLVLIFIYNMHLDSLFFFIPIVIRFIFQLTQGNIKPNFLVFYTSAIVNLFTFLDFANPARYNTKKQRLFFRMLPFVVLMVECVALIYLVQKITSIASICEIFLNTDLNNANIISYCESAQNFVQSFTSGMSPLSFNTSYYQDVVSCENLPNIFDNSENILSVCSDLPNYIDCAPIATFCEHFPVILDIYHPIYSTCGHFTFRLPFGYISDTYTNTSRAFNIKTFPYIPFKCEFFSDMVEKYHTPVISFCENNTIFSPATIIPVVIVLIAFSALIFLIHTYVEYKQAPLDIP